MVVLAFRVELASAASLPLLLDDWKGFGMRYASRSVSKQEPPSGVFLQVQLRDWLVRGGC